MQDDTLSVAIATEEMCLCPGENATKNLCIKRLSLMGGLAKKEKNGVFLTLFPWKSIKKYQLVRFNQNARITAGGGLQNIQVRNLRIKNCKKELIPSNGYDIVTITL